MRSDAVVSVASHQAMLKKPARDGARILEALPARGDATSLGKKHMNTSLDSQIAVPVCCFAVPGVSSAVYSAAQLTCSCR